MQISLRFVFRAFFLLSYCTLYIILFYLLYLIYLQNTSINFTSGDQNLDSCWLCLFCKRTNYSLMSYLAKINSSWNINFLSVLSHRWKISDLFITQCKFSHYIFGSICFSEYAHWSFCCGYIFVSLGYHTFLRKIIFSRKYSKSRSQCTAKMDILSYVFWTV